MSRLLDILAGVPLFAGLPRAAMPELAAQCTPRRVEDGAYLFHAEEAADRLYILAEGQLEVVRLGPNGSGEILLNTLSPGAVVGELAILRGETRSASVRAKGHVLVYGMDALTFHHDVRRWPELALAVARGVAESFIRAERRMAKAPVWAVVVSPALQPSFAVELAQAAAGQLRGQASHRLAVLAPLAGSLSERAGFRIEVKPTVYMNAAEMADAAAAEALRAAVVIVAGAPAELAEVLSGCSGVVAGPGQALPGLPSGVQSIEISPEGAPSLTRVRSGPAAAGRVARMLLNRSIGVALGGGAARGLAALGVLDELNNLGVPIDFMAGTSMGALLGAFYLANGLKATISLLEGLKDPMTAMAELLDPSPDVPGVMEGRKLLTFLERHLEVDRIEKLEVPFAAVSLDIDSGEVNVARTGRLADAVRASSSIPGFFMPYRYQPPDWPQPGSFVDGGLVSFVPVDVVRTMGATRVVGVHTSGRREPVAGEDGGFDYLSEGLQKLKGDPRVTTIARALYMALARSGERQVFTADVAVLAEATGFGFAELWRAHELIDVGRSAAQAVASELKRLGPTVTGS